MRCASSDTAARRAQPRSVLAYTISGGTIAKVRCNGQELGEIGLNAALAAHHGAVPVLPTGDHTLAREAESVVPGITTVAVKRAFGNRAAEGLHPRRIVHAPEFDGAVDLEVDVLRPFMTEQACLGFQAADFFAAYNVIDVFAILAASA